MNKPVFWIIAILITVAAALYQRITGPTYPARLSEVINGKDYTFSLKRSQTNTHPCIIRLALPSDLEGRIYYKRFRVDEEWTVTEMQHDGSDLRGQLPSQPAAGKLEYYIVLRSPSGAETAIARDEPVVIRFKGNVPAVVTY